MPKFVSLLILALFALGSHAEVYKWVDSEGITHYSQQPPEAGEAQQIPVPRPAAASAPQDGDSPSAAASEEPSASTEPREAELSEEIRAKRAEEDRKQAEADQQLAAACAKMRENLNTLRGHARVRIQENGSTRVMTPEEQAKQIVDLEKQIQDNCSQPQ